MATKKATKGEAKAAKEMKKLFSVRGKTFYWANSSFKYIGVWVWNGKRNVRVLAFNHINEWNGDQK